MPPITREEQHISNSDPLAMEVIRYTPVRNEAYLSTESP
jgi:hypothetical protein